MNANELHKNYIRNSFDAFLRSANDNAGMTTKFSFSASVRNYFTTNDI